jgi:hypothetical protein
MWGFSDHSLPSRRGSDVCYRLHLTVRSEFECSARECLGHFRRSRRQRGAACSQAQDRHQARLPLKGSTCGSHRQRILHPAIVAPRNFGGEVNPFRVRLYSAGVRETSRQGAGPPVGGPIGALSTTRHETHTSLTKCQDNGPLRSRFKDHALTRLSSRGSEVGSCQLIEGPLRGLAQ